MKRGFFTILVLSLMVGSSTVRAEPSACEKIKPRPSVININLETPEPYYDLDRSLAYLNSDGGKGAEEWLKKNNMQNIWSSKHMTTAGRAAGGWGAYYQYRMDAQPVDSTGLMAACLLRKLISR